MIHELRTYTLKPGTVPKALEASGTVARQIRGGDKYGKLEGHWSSEIGILNQYVHMWQFDSLNEMQRLRTELAALAAWQEEYIPHSSVASSSIQVPPLQSSVHIH